MADQNLQHQPGIPGDGIEDVEETTLDTELDHETASDENEGVNGDGNDANTTPNESLKTREELEEERRRAVSELFKFKDKEKQARAQLDEEFNDLLNLAREDVSVIDKIYTRNPEKADKLTKALFNMTYEEALEAAQSKEKTASSDTTPDIDAIVAQKVAEALGKKDEQAAQEDVQKEMDRLVASTGLPVTSAKFKRLMREIQEIGIPQNIKQARAFFKEAQENMRGSNEMQDTVDIGSAATLSGNAGISQNRIPMPSDGYFEQARLNGHTREQAIAAWKKVYKMQKGGF